MTTPDVATPRTDRRLGAEKLDATVISAGYWLDCAEKESTRDSAFFCARESSNHWKNAAYHFAEETAKLEKEAIAMREQLAERDAECRMLSSHVQALDGSLATLEGQLSTVTAERDAQDDCLHKIRQWCAAYPLDVFPEPDFKKAHEVLQANGMTLDAISASNMRHVVTGIQKLIAATKEQSNG